MAVDNPQLHAWLSTQFPSGTGLSSVKGDASSRRFYRIEPPGQPSLILMVYPERIRWEGSALKSNHEHFDAIGIPVPHLEGVFAEKGYLLLEDLGDLTLQKSLNGNPSVDRIPLYREAIDFLVLLQDRGTRELPAESPARKTILNEEKFLWELRQFHRHFLLGYRGARLHPLEEELLQQFYGWLCASLESVERVLCHRDYQSRNLMVTPSGLRVIDYQDARLGPVSYDLASLLRDSSLDLGADLVEEGIRYFLSRRSELAEEEFRCNFARVALQRNIKDLGTFGYQVHAIQNPEYESYIPRTLEMVRQSLVGERRYHDIFPIFEKHVFNRRAGSASPASR